MSALTDAAKEIGTILDHASDIDLDRWAYKVTGAEWFAICEEMRNINQSTDGEAIMLIDTLRIRGVEVILGKKSEAPSD